MMDGIYDDEYPTCDKTNCKLVVRSNDLSPQQITNIMNVAATSAYKKGSLLGRPRAGIQPIRKSNVWILSSEKITWSKDLRRHIDWLVDIIAPHQSGLFRLRDLNASIQLRCLWWSKHGHGGPILDLKQMGALCHLCLECNFEIGFYSDEMWVDQISEKPPAFEN